LPNRNSYIEIEPEIIDTQKTLSELKLNREQIVDLGILIGTDFNPDGFTRIGPKTALKMIREHSKLENIPQIQEQLELIDYNQIRKIFLEPDVSDVSEIKFGEVDYDGMTKYLVEDRNFSQDRVQTSLNRLKKAFEKKSHTLEQWFE